MALVYSSRTLMDIGSKVIKPVVSAVLHSKLKGLNICKPFRGLRGGRYKQRDIVTICSSRVAVKSQTRGVFTNNLVNVVKQEVCGNVPSTCHNINVLVSSKRAQNGSPKVARVPVLHTVTEQLNWDLPILLNANVRSLTYKTDELEHLVQSRSVDIVGLSETWCHSDQPSDVFSISGYNMVRRDRMHKRGGGVLVYIRSSIPYKHWAQLSDDFETSWIVARPRKLPRQFANLIIGILYHPPKANNKEMINHLTFCLDSILKEHPFSGIILMGDFNSLPDSRIKGAYNLKQIVTAPTRGSKVLDKVLTNMHALYKTPEVCPPIGTADHNVVICTPLPAYRTPAPKPQTTITRCKGQNQKALFADELMKVNWQPLFRMDSCTDQLTHFNTTIMSILDTHMPFKPTTKCSTDRPWITPYFKDLLKKRQHAYSCGNFSLYHALRNKVNRLNKSLRSAYYSSSIDAFKQADSRKWWAGVKQLTGAVKSGKHELSGLANSLCDGDMEQLAEMINTFFQSVSCDLPKPSKSLLPHRDAGPVPDKYIITVQDVEKQLMKLNLSKAPGPDGIPNWVLRDFAGYLAPPVASIFNASIREGCLPPIWKSATSCPVPKVKPPKLIEKDLRPISLTCVLSKNLETFVVKWLWEVILPFVDPYQFGALANCSTVHALIEVCHDWFMSTDNSKDKNHVHTVLIDYSKAFDRINPNILIQKLIALDVPVLILHWVLDFLSERTQSVRVGEATSSPLDIWATVPQGTKMGVVLFLIMINDLKTGCPTFKYVDDTTLYYVSNNPIDPSLQEAVSSVLAWSNQNDMRINGSKTKEMLISFSKSQADVPHISIDGSLLERVESVTLLGVQISNDLSWEKHVSFIVKKAQSRLFSLNMLRRAKVSSKDIMDIFCSKVRPVLEYASPLWHPGLTQEQSDDIENLQKRACKIAFPDLDYKDALKSCALPTLHERRHNLCHQFFIKIQNPKDKLHRILPPLNESRYCTRKAKKYPLPKTHTMRYKNSFLPYVLYNCQ